MERNLTIRVIFDDGKFSASVGKADQNLKDLNKTLAVTKKVKREAASAMMQNSQAMSSSTRTSANMTMALQSLNFTVRDSPYFFRDFSLGILAIGNNLNPLIDSMIAVKKEAKDMGGTLRGALWTALKGPAGVIFAFSALVSIMQAVIFAFDDWGDETEEAEKKVDKFTKKIETLNRAMLKANIGRIEAEVEQIGTYEDYLEEQRNKKQELGSVEMTLGRKEWEKKFDSIRCYQSQFVNS